jgi:MFS transporter, GlpU family, inner membrane protein
MFLLCTSGSLIYWLPFLSEVYYVPMQEAFGFSKTQMGNLMSIFGLVSMLAYVPGGWLADRIAPRKLITVALLITGLGGFVFSTFPSFTVCLMLHGLWGVTTGCIFWAAMIKATRNWGSREEQGRAFGILEGGRNATDMVAGTVLLIVFAYHGAGDAALANQIVIYASFAVALGILVWFLMKDGKETQEENSDNSARITLSDVGTALRLPIVWLLAIIIFCAYSGYWGAAYFTPYATEIFDLGAVYGGAIGTAKLWVAAAAAIAAGFIADRIGPAKAVLGAFIIMTAGFLIFAVTPGSAGLLPILLINVAVVSTAVYALRGIYFALLEHGGIPIAVTGTATGIISVIGYTPEIFIPTLSGMILDASPGPRGYQNLYLMITALSAIGMAAAYIVHRKVRPPPPNH